MFTSGAIRETQIKTTPRATAHPSQSLKHYQVLTRGRAAGAHKAGNAKMVWALGFHCLVRLKCLNRTLTLNGPNGSIPGCVT